MATIIITIVLSIFLITSVLFEKKVYDIADKIMKTRIGFVLVVLSIISISVFIIIQA